MRDAAEGSPQQVGGVPSALTRAPSAKQSPSPEVAQRRTWQPAGCHPTVPDLLQQDSSSPAAPSPRAQHSGWPVAQGPGTLPRDCEGFLLPPVPAFSLLIPDPPRSSLIRRFSFSAHTKLRNPLEHF